MHHCKFGKFVCLTKGAMTINLLSQNELFQLKKTPAVFGWSWDAAQTVVGSLPVPVSLMLSWRLYLASNGYAFSVYPAGSTYLN